MVRPRARPNPGAGAVGRPGARTAAHGLAPSHPLRVAGRRVAARTRGRGGRGTRPRPLGTTGPRVQARRQGATAGCARMPLTHSAHGLPHFALGPPIRGDHGPAARAAISSNAFRRVGAPTVGKPSDTVPRPSHLPPPKATTVPPESVASGRRRTIPDDGNPEGQPVRHGRVPPWGRRGQVRAGPARAAEPPGPPGALVTGGRPPPWARSNLAADGYRLITCQPSCPRRPPAAGSGPSRTSPPAGSSGSCGATSAGRTSGSATGARCSARSGSRSPWRSPPSPLGVLYAGLFQNDLSVQLPNILVGFIIWGFISRVHLRGLGGVHRQRRPDHPPAGPAVGARLPADVAADAVLRCTTWSSTW